MRTLTTVDEVILALGGATAAVRLAGLQTPAAASQWSTRGRIPPDKWLIFSAALKERGFEALPGLFGFADVEGAGL